MMSNLVRLRTDGSEAQGSRVPIEAADGVRDGGHQAPRPLGLDLLDPATWRSLAIGSSPQGLA